MTAGHARWAVLAAVFALACGRTSGLPPGDSNGDLLDGTPIDLAPASPDGACMAARPCYDGPAGTVGVGACHAGVQTCIDGQWSACAGEVVPQPESCNGIDDDCNGAIDDGNPGGGASCDISVGSCTGRITCVDGALVCRGTFVAPLPLGDPANQGTSLDPLSTISAAIANATLLGGADVCVCAPSGGLSQIADDVTMVEGVSVRGGYDCQSWKDSGNAAPELDETAPDGVKFSAGLSSATSFSQLQVRGLSIASGTSTAITIIDSSPTITGVFATSGSAPSAHALDIVRVNAANVSPVIDATLTAGAPTGGEAIGVFIDGASPSISSYVVAGSDAASSVPTSTVAIRCVDCAGTQLFNTQLVVAESQRLPGVDSTGFEGTGNMAGFAMISSHIDLSGGAQTNTGRGVYLHACTGSPLFRGGFVNSNAAGLSVGMDISGAACQAAIDEVTITTCNFGEGGTCVGLQATGALITATGLVISGAAGYSEIAYGVSCLAGGCASIVKSQITGTINTNTQPLAVAATLNIDSSSPLIDSNRLNSPSCSSTNDSCNIIRAVNSTATLINNELLNSPLGGVGLPAPELVRVELTGPNPIAPIIVNNTMEYSSCGSCADLRGFSVVGSTAGTGTVAAGVFNNNLVVNFGSGGMSWPVWIWSSNTNFAAFQNNDLYDPTAQALFQSPDLTLNTASQLNSGIPTASSNISADPQLTLGAWQLAATSPCRNAGTASFAPDHDFDGDPRPGNEATFDIGSDQY